MAGFGIGPHALEAYWFGGSPTRPSFRMPGALPSWEAMARSTSNGPPFEAVANLILRPDSGAHDWLVAWFRRELTPDGCHCGAEFPATTYYHALEYPAWAAILVSVERGGDTELEALARAHVERTICATTIMLSRRWTYVGPAMRSKQPRPRAGGEDLAYLLGRRVRWGEGDWSVRHASRLMREAQRRRYDRGRFCRESVLAACTAWLDRRVVEPQLLEVLATIISGPAPVVVRHYEGGHEAFYASSPVGYDNQQPGAAAYPASELVACVRDDLFGAGRFRGEELKPGAPVLIEESANGMVYSIAPRPEESGWKRDGWRRQIARPPGALIHEFRIAGRTAGVVAPDPPATEPAASDPRLDAEGRTLLGDLRRVRDILDAPGVRSYWIDPAGASPQRVLMGETILEMMQRRG